MNVRGGSSGFASGMARFDLQRSILGNRGRRRARVFRREETRVMMEEVG